MYQVNEIFHSIQGEGVLTGIPSTFVRLQGCAVGCPWCDTKYTWAKGGTKMEVADIMNEIRHDHVVITGGEPTLHNLDDLIVALHRQAVFVQLETSGQQWLKGEVMPDWITLSPKRNLDFSWPWPYDVRVKEFKWVIDDEFDWHLVDSAWTQIRNVRNRKDEDMPYFVFMPEGCPPSAESVKKVLDFFASRPSMPHQWRYGDRIQYRIGVR
jgi:organic radical activating enzyme